LAHPIYCIEWDVKPPQSVNPNFTKFFVPVACGYHGLVLF